MYPRSIAPPGKLHFASTASIARTDSMPASELSNSLKISLRRSPNPG